MITNNRSKSLCSSLSDKEAHALGQGQRGPHFVPPSAKALLSPTCTRKLAPTPIIKVGFAKIADDPNLPSLATNPEWLTVAS